MTREIRYPDDGHSRAPKYIDHGHRARKAVYWAVVALALPIGVAQVCAARFVDLCEPVARAVGRLQVWSHPCLYAKPPKLPAPELSPEWRAGIPKDEQP